MWKGLDLKKLESELELHSNAQSDGGFNLPSSDSTTMSATELRIVNEVTEFWRNSVTNNTSYFSGLEKRILNSEALVRADGHEGQSAEIKMQTGGLVAEIKAVLEPLRESFNFEKESLRTFKLANDLVRPAEIKTQSFKFWLIALAVVMFFAETVGNSTLLINKISGGILGAVSFASIISFINIVLSWLMGRMVLPQLNHKKKNRNNLAKLVLFFYAPIIIYFNFAMGVFRSLSEAQEAIFTSTGLQSAALAAAFPFSNIESLTIASIGLIVIGFLFAGIALAEGYNYEDPYPEYGEINKRYLNARNSLDEEIKKGIKKLNEFSISSTKQIYDLKEKRIEANKVWDDSIDSIQDSFADYKTWSEGLITSGQALLEIYRADNLRFRVEPQPPYFNEDYNFEIETDPDIRISNLSHHHMSDPEKVSIVEQNNDTIMTEYNNTTSQMTEFFNDELDKLGSYMDQLRT